MRPGRWGIALAGALCAAALAVPAAASAHATLEASTPARGATVTREPAAVVFRFDETVEGDLGAVRVFDTRGRRVDEGDAFHPGGAGSRLGVHLRPGLPDGTYTATYRVVSADGHIVSSGIVFSIGRPSGAGESVAGLLRASQTGPVTSTAFTVARALSFGALGVAGGALLFLLAVWMPALRAARSPGERWAGAGTAFLRRCRLLLAGGAAAGAVAALAGLVLEAAEAAGVSGWAALRPHLLGEVLGTRFGTTWAIAAGAWIVFGAIALAIRARHEPAWALLVPLAYLVLVPALSGHGATQSPTIVLFPSVVVHVLAMTAWLGGLVALLVAAPAATRRLEPAERTVLLAGALRRFSALALGAVGVLLVTGLVQSYLEIRHLDLVFTTAFGRAAFIKAALLAALVVLGAVNRRRTVPRLAAAAAARRSPGADGVLLRRTLRAEVALIGVVLVVTGALAGYAPATTAASGPYSATTRVGPQELQITVDPARIGANQVHLYLTDPRTGAQLDSAKEVHVEASLPARGIGRISEHAHRAGPGHYIVPDLMLGVAGTWRLAVTVRVSAFDEYTKTLSVAVR